MNPKQPIRKKSFLLIEVLIAFTLLALAFFPLLKEKISLDIQKKKFLSQTNISLLAKEAFVDLMVSMDQEGILSFEDLEQGVYGICPTTYTSNQKEIHFQYRLKPKKRKGFSKDSKVLLVECQIFTPAKTYYVHSFVLDRNTLRFT